jgi:hypothetical protein
MNRYSSALAITALVGELGVSGCKAETMVKYEGTPFTDSEVWSSGKSLNVLGVNGQINIRTGQTGTVVATFRPFTHRGSGQEDEANREMTENLTVGVSREDSTGTVLVSTSRSGGSTGLGAVVDLEIPPDFDADIRVNNQVGGVKMEAVGQATVIEVINPGVGNCTVLGAPSVANTFVTCGWDITVANVSDHVEVTTDNLLDSTRVDVSIAQVTATTGTSPITLAAGRAQVTLPAAGNFTVSARAIGGTVDLGAVPAATCTTASNTESAKSMTCGTGDPNTLPNYLIQAGTDSSQPGNIVLSYR